MFIWLQGIIELINCMDLESGAHGHWFSEFVILGSAIKFSSAVHNLRLNSLLHPRTVAMVLDTIDKFLMWIHIVNVQWFYVILVREDHRHGVFPLFCSTRSHCLFMILSAIFYYRFTLLGAHSIKRQIRYVIFLLSPCIFKNWLLDVLCWLA